MSTATHAARAALTGLREMSVRLAEHYADRQGLDPSDPSLTVGVPSLMVGLVDELHAAEPQDTHVARLVAGLREHQLKDENDPRRALTPIAIPLATLLELLDPIADNSVAIYEDGAGGVHLVHAGKAWDLGLVTLGMYGLAKIDAHSLCLGAELAAECAEDPTTIDPGAHRLIATFSPATGLVVELNEHGQPCAGLGGRQYLGLTPDEHGERA